MSGRIGKVRGIVYLTKQTRPDHDSLDRPALEITPAMIEAGAAALAAHEMGLIDQAKSTRLAELILRAAVGCT